MTKRYKTIPAGHFRGKRITIADTDRVKEHRDTAGEFMAEIFDLSPGEYVISDESSLSDFVSFDQGRTNELWNQITARYAVNAAAVGTDRLVDIFDAIVRRRLAQ